MFVDDHIVIYIKVKNQWQIIINVIWNNETLPFELDTFNFRFRILNIFSLNGTEISFKSVLYSGVFISWGSTVFTLQIMVAISKWNDIHFSKTTRIYKGCSNVQSLNLILELLHISQLLLGVSSWCNG